MLLKCCLLHINMIFPRHKCHTFTYRSSLNSIAIVTHFYKSILQVTLNKNNVSQQQREIPTGICTVKSTFVTTVFSLYNKQRDIRNISLK